MPDVDAVNSGYARVLLEQYLENPEAVPSEWRALFESGDGDLIQSLPGLARLLENLRETNGHAEPAPVPAPAAKPAPVAPPEPAPAAPDEALLGGVAAAMSLVKALRTHGHLAARLDPLGSEPVGDPALEPERLQPALTPELQARIPASLLRVHTARRSPRYCRNCRRPTPARAPSRSSTSPTTSSGSGCARRSNRGGTAMS